MLPDDRFDLTQEDDILVVRLIDSPRAKRDPWIELVEFARATHPPKMLVDLSGVSWISSSMGINTLVMLWQEIRKYDGRMVICNLPPLVREEFEITRLDQLFQVAADREAGLQALEE